MLSALICSSRAPPLNLKRNILLESSELETMSQNSPFSVDEYQMSISSPSSMDEYQISTGALYPQSLHTMELSHEFSIDEYHYVEASTCA